MSRADSPRTISRPRSVLTTGEARIFQLRRLVDDPKRLETELASLPSSDLPALIELLAAKGGIEGLPGEERERISGLLKRGYEASPDDMIAWILNAEHPGNRRFYFQTVFEAAAAKDPMRALELAERIRRDTGDGLSLPRAFINDVARSGADSLVRAVALTLGKAESMSGWAVDFPVDFDFKAAANGIADLYERKKPGENLRTYPCNIVEAWVKKDAQAAYAWASANDERGKMFSSGLADFFTGYAKVAEPAVYGRFAAEATLDGEPNERSWDIAFSALMSHPETAVVEAFLSAASVSRDTGEVLTKLIDASDSYYSCDVLRQALFNRLPEEQRAKYLLTAPGNLRRKLGAEPAR